MVAKVEPNKGRAISRAATSIEGRLLAPLRFLEPAHQMLEHHDRVIDDEADGSRHAAKGHHVEAHVQRVKRKTGRSENRRQKRSGNHHQAPAAKEQEQHEASEHGAKKYRVANRIRSARYQLGLVIEEADLHVRRKRSAGDPGVDLLYQRNRVRGRGLANIQRARRRRRLK